MPDNPIFDRAQHINDDTVLLAPTTDVPIEVGIVADKETVALAITFTDVRLGQFSLCLNGEQAARVAGGISVVLTADEDDFNQAVDRLREEGQ